MSANICQKKNGINVNMSVRFDCVFASEAKWQNVRNIHNTQGGFHIQNIIVQFAYESSLLYVLGIELLDKFYLRDIATEMCKEETNQLTVTGQFVPIPRHSQTRAKSAQLVTLDS